MALGLRDGYSADLGEPVWVVRRVNQAGEPPRGALREVFTFAFGGVAQTFDFLASATPPPPRRRSSA